MLERCLIGIGEASNDDTVIGGPAQLTSQAEISEQKFGFGLAVILGESHWGGETKPEVVFHEWPC
jgi:hypothetical protein